MASGYTQETPPEATISSESLNEVLARRKTLTISSDTLDEVLTRRRDSLKSSTSVHSFTSIGLRRALSVAVEAALREHAQLALRQSADENHSKNSQAYEVRKGVLHGPPMLRVHDREDYTSDSGIHVQQVKTLKLLQAGESMHYSSSNASVDISWLLQDGVMPEEAKEAWPLNFVTVQCPEAGLQRTESRKWNEREYWWQLTFMRKSIEELCEKDETKQLLYEAVTKDGFVERSEWMRVLDSVPDSVSLEPLSPKHLC